MGSIGEWHVGQLVALKKPHPCGVRIWTIYKLGRDVGLQCQLCGQRVKLVRRTFERAVEGDEASRHQGTKASRKEGPL
ncbi:MAG: DUF951 domain-containing protein [Nitrospinae bacterium]|nr:DUF951 domain-containing protein [Nitrospinota bacterium]